MSGLDQCDSDARRRAARRRHIFLNILGLVAWAFGPALVAVLILYWLLG